MTPHQPTTPQALAEAMQAASAVGRNIQLGGAFTKNSMGGALPADPVVLSTAGLRRVLRYEPGDLTLSVEAGLPFAAIRELLAGQRQMLPLDPPWSNAATIGGVVASNTHGPRCRLYGSVRDLVIGMSLATLDGRIVETGGMVVKNVAGLDVQKLMIGSFGTLAAITSVNFKLAPMPPATRTFRLSSPQWPVLAEARDRVLGGVLQPAAVEMLNARAAARCGLTDATLLVRAGGSERVLARYQKELEPFEPIDGGREAALWEALEEFTPRYLAETPNGCVLKVRTTLDKVTKVMASLPEAGLARAATGVVHGYFATPGHARAWLDRHRPESGPALLEAGPETERARQSCWAAPGDDFSLMQRLKALFDPDNRLNPGRLYGRL
jgi:glycolate oxidase FAD binding subunit